MRREIAQHAERRFAFVESELNQERAAALGRAVHRVRTSFERCMELIPLADQHGGQALDEYRQARAAFDRSRWELCVHREAIGLNNHSWIDQTFPVPPRR